MFARLRDLLTGFLVVAVAFGLVDWALRRPAIDEAPGDSRPVAPTPEPRAEPVSAAAEIAERVGSRGTASMAAISTGSAFVIALLGAAPILVAVVAFGGREGVPLGSRVLVGVAVLALAAAAGVLLIVRPIASRHAAVVVAAIGIEMVAVMAAIAIDSAS